MVTSQKGADVPIAAAATGKNVVKHTVILWYRQDLRLADNPALEACIEHGRAIIPVYVWAPQEEQPWAPGRAARAWLHYSLERFAGELEQKGSRLIVTHGPAAEALAKLAMQTGASVVHCSRRYEPAAREQELRVQAALQTAGLTFHTHNSALLFEPWDVRKESGDPYRVFTPFWKRCMAAPEPPPPTPAPARMPAPEKWPASTSLSSLNLLAEAPGHAIMDHWTPGEAGAASLLDAFVEQHIDSYPRRRDLPAVDGTSRLSPHLHFGEISPRQIWHAAASAQCAGSEEAVQAFLRQLGWREFSYSLLYHFPHTTDAPLVSKFAAFPWREDPEALRRWQEGKTGYPFVDAGMRQLLETGWMHNRVRMIAASFLVKDLLIPWQQGARWFWEQLVDADLANNTQGWQWVAGCGADAAPYFRIFNPTAQGKRYDPDAAYVRRWVPELAGGGSYPPPVVDHAHARDLAMDAFRSL
jgi:deoxyribodipyrimidine photo-lyase